MYSQTVHSLRSVPSVLFQVLNIRTAIYRSGKILNNSFRNKNRTSIHLFTPDLNNSHEYNSLLIPFTENLVTKGCFSPKKSSYTRMSVYIGSTFSGLFHVKPVGFLSSLN